MPNRRRRGYRARCGPGDSPDFARASADRNVQFLLRFGRRRNQSTHTNAVQDFDHTQHTPITAEYDPDHNSWNQYYRTDISRPCKCEPRPGNTFSALEWKFESDGPRQAARAYLPPETPVRQSIYVMVAFEPNARNKLLEPARKALKTMYVAHPDVAEGRVAATGDVAASIARLTHARQRAETNALWAIFDSPSQYAMAYYQPGAS